jgi:transposase
MLQRGREIKPKIIAKQLGVSGQSVDNWAHAWRDGCVGGHNGGPGVLSEAMVATPLKIARVEALTLGSIAPRVQEIRAETAL